MQHPRGMFTLRSSRDFRERERVGSDGDDGSDEGKPIYHRKDDEFPNRVLSLKKKSFIIREFLAFKERPTSFSEFLEPKRESPMY